MGDPVEIAFRRAADALLPQGTPVLVAVSGGGDSVALLHLLRRVPAARGLTLTVAHLDHALRRGSAADRRFVERLAQEHGLPRLAMRRDVPALRRRDESPEEAARRIRREFLIEGARRVGARAIALGHTLDDQAETVLLRLARGAGPTALAAMRAAGPGPFVRPLLGIERAVLRGWLERRGLAWREDPSNRNLQYDRNRLRRRVVPLLAAELNPRVARHIVEAATRLREDAEHLDALAGQALERLAATESGRVSLDVAALGRLARPLASRVARLALARAGADGRRVTASHVEALLHLALTVGPRHADLPGGLAARRIGGRLVLGPR